MTIAQRHNTRHCSVPNCGNRHYGLGFCRKHWERFVRHGDPLMVYAMFGATVAERLERYSEPEGECIVWTGHRTARGYGQIQVNGKPTGAHRAAYQEAHGSIPPGMVVRHSCDNPPCVNPDHLLIGTVADNNHDKAVRGRAPVVGIAKASREARLARLAMENE